MERKQLLFSRSTLYSSLPLVVDRREPHWTGLLLKSPPAINFEPSVSKNVSNCYFFKLCRGGQYTAATVISYRSLCTLMDVACKASSSHFNCT